jgi:hypothetical protein
MWMRLAAAVIGSTRVRGCMGTSASRPGWVTNRPTGWTMTGADSISATGWTSVTMVLLGTCSTGRSFATNCFASWRERPKNMGSTSALFSSVITFASSLTVVMQRLPSRTGASTSGKRRTIRAPTCRWYADPRDKPTSRCKKSKRLENPSCLYTSCPSNSARATRRSARADCSRRASSAMRRDHSRAFMEALSHADSGPLQTHGNALPGIPVRGDLGPRQKPRSPLLNEMRPPHAYSRCTPSA